MRVSYGLRDSGERPVLPEFLFQPTVLRLHEIQQICVQHVCIYGQHPVREARIRLDGAVLQKLDRLMGGVCNGDDLVVFAMQN